MSDSVTGLISELKMIQAMSVALQLDLSFINHVECSCMSIP